MLRAGAYAEAETMPRAALDGSLVTRGPAGSALRDALAVTAVAVAV